MSSNWRRYEVLLPLQFNDGSEVPGDWISDAVFEMVEHFGAASHEPQSIEGHWRHGETIYRDNLVRIVVDVEDLPEHRSWMREFKSRWKVKLQQLELWLVSYQIELD